MWLFLNRKFVVFHFVKLMLSFISTEMLMTGLWKSFYFRLVIAELYLQGHVTPNSRLVTIVWLFEKINFFRFSFSSPKIFPTILILVQLSTQPWSALESQRESDPKFDTALNLGTLSLGLSFCLTLITHFYHLKNNEKDMCVFLHHNLNSICFLKKETIVFNS